jgi:cyanophycin synthetase
MIVRNLGVLPGHLFGLSQRVLIADLDIELPEALDFAAIDRRLGEAFEMTVSAPKGAPGLLSDRRLAPVVAYVSRLGQLANVLLQDIRVPTFDPGYIDAIAPLQSTGKRGACSVRLAMPRIEGIPSDVFRSACEMAERALQAIARPHLFDEALQDLFDRIQTEFSDRCSPQIPGARSTVPILEGAHRAGIPFRHLGMGIYRLGWGERSLLVNRSANQLDSFVGAGLAQNKHLTSRVLAAAGFPTIENFPVATAEQAWQRAERIGCPVVIKPADRDRGEGVTTFLHSRESVLAAFDKAAEYSRNVLVEKHVPGICHRISVAHGRLLFVVRRMPRSVQGDGSRSIAELIDDANAALRRKAIAKRLPVLPKDALAESVLQARGYSFDTVPPAGEVVYLRDKQSTLWGGTPEVLTARAHPDNIRLALDVARHFGLDSMGLDLMTEDIAVPWHANDARINEVNPAPVLGRTHAYQREGIATLLDALFPENAGRIPVELVVTRRVTPALRTALEGRLRESGEGAALAIGNETLDHLGRPWPLMTGGTLFDRVHALLERSGLRKLIVVVADDQFLRRGFPVDRLTAVHCHDARSGRVVQLNDNGAGWTTDRLPVTVAALLSG